MNEYLFFQDHKADLGDTKDLSVVTKSEGGMTEKDKMTQKFGNIITKLEEDYEGCKSPQQKMNRALGIASPKKLTVEERKDTKHEFTDETMKFGLENISEKYKD